MVFAAITSQAQRTLIHCGKLLDVKNSKLMGNYTIIVSGNQILNIAEGFVKGEAADKMIDLKNRTVMPGLMDMHVHLESETNPNQYMERFTYNAADYAFQSVVFAERTLMSGFTTVRDLGGSGVNISLRNAIQKGHIRGPRVFSAGKSIATTGGHADPTNGYRKDLMGDPGPEAGVANGRDELSKAVRQRYKDGSDLIKITASGAF